MTAKEHNKLVGIFLMAHGGLQAVVMIFICIMYGGFGVAMFFGSGQKDAQIAGIFFIVAIAIIAVVSAVFVVPQIIGGLKVLKENPNARGWGIVAAVICCLSFPLGTAAGVYAMWFLFGDMGKQFYLGGGQQSFQQSPPQPNSWQ